MSIHNAQGAQWLKELGFCRVVLSRELPLTEVKHITQTVGVETEVFIHGALCYSYSGQCLMSSLMGDAAATGEGARSHAGCSTA